MTSTLMYECMVAFICAFSYIGCCIRGVVLEVLEEGRQESLPTILCEPDSFGGRSEPPKPVDTRGSPRASLGLLSPLRCSAATLIHRIFRIR